MGSTAKWIGRHPGRVRILLNSTCVDIFQPRAIGLCRILSSHLEKREELSVSNRSHWRGGFSERGELRTPENSQISILPPSSNEVCHLGAMRVDPNIVEQSGRGHGFCPLRTNQSTIESIQRRQIQQNSLDDLEGIDRTSIRHSSHTSI